MRLKKAVNNSGANVRLKHKDAAETILPPGGRVENVEISNYDEVKESITATIDLTEVGESQGKQKLYD